MALVEARHAPPTRPCMQWPRVIAGSSHIAVAPGYIAIRA